MRQRSFTRSAGKPSLRWSSRRGPPLACRGAERARESPRPRWGSCSASRSKLDDLGPRLLRAPIEIGLKSDPRPRRSLASRADRATWRRSGRRDHDRVRGIEIVFPRPSNLVRVGIRRTPQLSQPARCEATCAARSRARTLRAAGAHGRSFCSPAQRRVVALDATPREKRSTVNTVATPTRRDEESRRFLFDIDHAAPSVRGRATKRATMARPAGLLEYAVTRSNSLHSAVSCLGRLPAFVEPSRRGGTMMTLRNNPWRTKGPIVVDVTARASTMQLRSDLEARSQRA